MNNKSIFYAVFSLILMACSGGANWEKNNLGASHSPYLLQHADNPVHWQEWSEAAFETAKSQNKLVLVSVGYAACHWCHVMERESFEDDSVAHLMNAHFINIKVDREERPEVDRALIDMAQKISGRAGWPLNVVLLPDGKPITAGTYFPKEHWLKLLSQITETWNENPDELRKLGDRIHRGLAYQKLTFEAERNNQADTAMIHDWMEKWSYQWDTINGGYSGTPKFPLPNDLMTFLNYGVLSGKRGFVTHTQNTVSKMLKGGIYDQLAGGFARYAIDSAWNIPHFEKMLYDNAQLLKIMAVLYQLTDEPKYRLGIEETWEWLSAMKSSEGGYYASLNAESEGEEGKYYVWQLDEVQKILGKATPWVSKYYGLTKAGNWDNGRNILFQAGSPEEICHEFDIDVSNWLDTLNWANEKLLERRQKREAPSTDRKIIAAWNALLINGFLHCYLATQDEKFLNESLIIADFLKNTMMNEKGEVWRSSFEGKRNIKAGLTDYAYLIDAFVSLYQTTLDKKWLEEASLLMGYVESNFISPEKTLFQSSQKQLPLAVPIEMDYTDNVMPSANSVLAKNLFRLGHFYYDTARINRAEKMVGAVLPYLQSTPQYFANWMDVLLWQTYPYFEVAVAGPEAVEILKEIRLDYRPNVLWLGTETSEYLPLLEQKFVRDKTLIYVCLEKSCKLPVEEVEKAKKQLGMTIRNP